MTAIIETFIGHQIYESIDTSGTCSHACSSQMPFKICEVEANELNRFDPDAYNALQSQGLTVEVISIDDIDKVGEKISLLDSIVAKYGDGKNEFLYKYAISYILKEALLISKQDPLYDMHIECKKKFKNPMLDYP